MNLPRPSTWRSLIVFTVCLLCMICASRTLQAQKGSSWVYTATQPQAVTLSSTNSAKSLWTLYPFKGRLFAGYGSFNNPGAGEPPNQPITITPYNPVTEQFETSPSFPAFTTDTELIGIYRQTANRLYAPSMDAFSGGLTPQDFASTIDLVGNQWQDHREVNMYHVWDMASLSGSDYDLFFVGMAGVACPSGTCAYATVWRSTDGGATFQNSLTVAPALGSGNPFSEFRFAGVFNGKLYVQAYERGGSNPQSQAESWVFDGTSWQIGPDLLPPGVGFDSDYGYQPTVFDFHMIYQTRFSVAFGRKELVALDADDNVKYLNIPPGIITFTVSGGYLYLLAADGTVRRTTSLSTPWDEWEQLPDFPVMRPEGTQTAGCSIAVLNGVVYIGTTDADLYKLI